MVIKPGVIPEEGKVKSCFLQVVLMPNGEVICLGKTVGWFKELKNFLHVPAVQK